MAWKPAKLLLTKIHELHQLASDDNHFRNQIGNVYTLGTFLATYIAVNNFLVLLKNLNLPNVP